MRKFYGVKRVYYYEKFFESGIVENESFSRVHELVKNLGYNSQFLEHLCSQLKNEDLHKVVQTSYIKTFIVTGMGIIELLLYYLLKSKSLHRTVNLKEIDKISSGEKAIEGRVFKTVTTVYEKIEAQEVPMSLNQMLNKIEKKRVFGDKRELYAKLNKLRNKRNKVHLHVIKEDGDHEWFNFSKVEFRLMKECLIGILLESDSFDYPEEKRRKLFDFLLD